MEAVAAVAEEHQFVGLQPNLIVAQTEDLTVVAGPYKSGFDAAAAVVVIAVDPSQFDDHLQSLVGTTDWEWTVHFAVVMFLYLD